MVVEVSHFSSGLKFRGVAGLLFFFFNARIYWDPLNCLPLLPLVAVKCLNYKNKPQTSKIQ